MFRLSRLTAATVLLALPLLSGPVCAQPAEPVSSTDVERETATAQVVGIDPVTRVISIKTEDGKVTDVKAGEDIRNFAQIKVGDIVVATLQRSLTYTVSPKGTQAAADAGGGSGGAREAR